MAKAQTGCGTVEIEFCALSTTVSVKGFKTRSPELARGRGDVPKIRICW
jgi:hypothetical protein